MIDVRIEKVIHLGTFRNEERYKKRKLILLNVSNKSEKYKILKNAKKLN